MEFLYRDKTVCVCIKPAGVLSTDEPGGLPELVRCALGGEAYTVHRLDQVVSGVIVLARTAEAAGALSAQIREKTFDKTYLAVVRGCPQKKAGTFTDLLMRDRVSRRTYVTKTPQRFAQEAVLDYEVLGTAAGLSLVRINLRTGRTHQIRAQFSSRRMPLWGDRKYGKASETGPIALWSHSVAFDHPRTGRRLTLAAPPPAAEPWTFFALP